MRKKAIMSFNMMMWIHRTVFLVLVFLAVTILTNSYARTEVITWRAESESFSQRVLYSPTGLPYHDPLSNRLYPGTIDLEKVEDPLLDQSIFYGQDYKKIGARIQVTDMEGNLLADTIYNSPVYKRIAEEGRKGKGGVDVSRKNIYVLAKDRQATYPATAEITVVVPRS